MKEFYKIYQELERSCEIDMSGNLGSVWVRQGDVWVKGRVRWVGRSNIKEHPEFAVTGGVTVQLPTTCRQCFQILTSKLHEKVI